MKEKDKRPFHITTATHDSRTSKRMQDFSVREKRDKGLRPNAEPIWFTPDDEVLITKIIAKIVNEDNLKVLSYNICRDHIHLLLVCDEDEVNSIVGKIKSITAHEFNHQKRNSTDNRVKHNLPKNNALRPIIAGMVCDFEEAFKVELMNQTTQQH
ncbi:MAG: transposase [Bacteroidetes bacterium]|nr:transposase [Bacteroidota bacterium]